MKNKPPHFPYWDQLPKIDLYLDQVLEYVNQVMQENYENPQVILTPSMVNNYVKHGYIPKPVKKKYGTLQVARLICITTLKPVFSIQEIWLTIEHLKLDSPTLYNHFVEAMAQNSQQAPQVIQLAADTLTSYYQTRNLLLQMKETHDELQS